MTDTIRMPPREDPRWEMIADGRIQVSWSNLAMKIMMSRIALEVSRNRTESAVQKYGDQIFEFFLKNEKAAAQDLRAIFR